MSLEAILGAVGAGSSIISSIGGWFQAAKNAKAEENLLNWQKEAYADNKAWQQQMAQTMMSREDSSVRRRVADLRQAGLSPTLAAGSAAQAQQVQAPVQPSGMRAPQINVPEWSLPAQQAMAALSLMQMKKDIDKTDAQIKAQQIQNDFATQINPIKVSDATIDVYVKNSIKDLHARSMNQDIINKQWEAKVKQTGIASSELQQDYQRVKNQLQVSHDVPAAQMDLIAKDVSLRLLKLKHEEGEYNYSLYRLAGTPTTQQWTYEQKLASQVTNLIGNLLNKDDSYRKGYEDRNRSQIPGQNIISPKPPAGGRNTQ